MATVKVVLNKDRIKKQGDYALVIQIIHKRVKRVIYTPYKLQEKEFDAVMQRAIYTDGTRYTRRQIKEINEFTERKRGEITEIITYLSTNDRHFTTGDIIKKHQMDQSERYLVTFMEHHIEKKLAQGKMGRARTFRSTLRSLKKYIGNREVKFADIDHYFVKGYEEFLQQHNVKLNTIGFYLRNLQVIYNLAFESGVEMGNSHAFRKIKIGSEKTVKRALKQAVIVKLSLMDFSDKPELESARDLFMFSFYTRGMSFVDIIYLKHTDIVDDVIYYRRRKTNQLMEITVTKPLRRIIDKYNTDQTYVLPFINDSDKPSLYDKYLSIYGVFYRNLNRIREMLNLKTPLTTYVARHSWATIAKELGVITSIISEGLGHTSEKTTLIYLKEFDRSVLDMANEKIVSFLHAQCEGL